MRYIDFYRGWFSLPNGIANVVLGDLNLHFQGQTFNISETVRASAKMQAVTFIDVDICNRMASLRMTFVTLTEIMKDNIFKRYYFKNDKN